MDRKETAVLELVINGKQAETSMNAVYNEMRKLEKEFRKMNEADNPALYKEKADAVNRLKQAYNEMRGSINGVSNESEKAWKQIAKGVITGQSIVSVFQYAASSIREFVKGAINTYATFEKMGAVLGNALGSKSEAKKALDDLQNFAAKTPFQLQELIGSYLKLVNRGMRPTMEQMKLMGDLAASQGKSFDQLTEAVLDATTGQFERLKEFGINASKNGDKVSLSFKGITKEVKYSSLAIQGALEDFAKMNGVAGSMESMGHTLEQTFSNLGDNLDKLAVKWGSKTGGFIYTIVSGFSYIIAQLAETRSKSQELTDNLLDSAKGVKSLEGSLNPLLSKYDELKSKTKLNKDEQTQLHDVINQIALLVPTAVTGYDQLGNAIDINKGKITEYLAVQKELLKYQNQEAIKATEEEIKSLEKKRDELNLKLNTQSTTYFQPGNAATGDGGKTITRKLTGDELLKYQADIKDTSVQLQGLRNRLTGLNGDYLTMLSSSDDQIKKQQEIAAAAQDAAMKKQQAEAQALKDAKKREKQLEQLKKNVAKELEDFKQSGMDPLDKIVEQITYHFDDLIAQAEKLGKTDLVKQLKELRDKNVDTAATNYNTKKAEEDKKQALKDKQDELKAAQTLSDSYYQIEKNKVAEQYANGLISKEQYDAQTEELERERIKSLIDINQQYGISTVDLEKQLTDMKIAENDREAEHHKQNELKKKEFTIQMAQLASDTIFSIVSESQKAQLDEKIQQINKQRDAELNNKELSQAQVKAINDKYDRQVAAEKTKAWKKEQEAAAVQALINGALAITNIFATTPKVDFGISTYLLIAASAAATLASEAKILSAKPPKFGGGGFIPDGASHDQGGMNVIDSRSGKVVANIEGGEPILSKETYRNNKATIDALLYSSQRKNGASIQLDTQNVIAADRYFRSGGVIAPPEWKQTVTNNNNSNFDMSETNTLLKKLVEKNNKTVTEFNIRTFHEYYMKFLATQDDASA